MMNLTNLVTPLYMEAPLEKPLLLLLDKAKPKSYVT